MGFPWVFHVFHGFLQVFWSPAAPLAGHGGHQRGGVGPQHGDVGARLRRALHTGGAGGGPGVELSFNGHG